MHLKMLEFDFKRNTYVFYTFYNVKDVNHCLSEHLCKQPLACLGDSVHPKSSFQMHHWEGRPSAHCYLFHSHYNHFKQAQLFSQSVLGSPGHKCHIKHTHTLCLCLHCTLAGSLSTRINVVGKHNADKPWQFYTWFQAAAFKWKSKETASSRAVVFQLHSMISSNCGFTKHWLCMPAFPYIYSAGTHICLCTADLPCYVNQWLLHVRKADWDRKEVTNSLLDLIHPRNLCFFHDIAVNHTYRLSLLNRHENLNGALKSPNNLTLTQRSSWSLHKTSNTRQCAHVLKHNPNALPPGKTKTNDLLVYCDWRPGVWVIPDL